MAFRQFGGVQFSAKQNYVSNQYNMIPQLGVPTQLGEAGTVLKIASDISGNITWYGTLQITDNLFVNESLVVQAGITAITDYGASPSSTLTLMDISSNNRMEVLLCSQSANWNPLVELGDEVIVSISGAGKARQNMSITSWSDTNTGVKITPTTVAIGAGGNLSTPSNYFKSDISGNTIQGNTRVNGTVTATAFIQSSDYRIKDCIHPLTKQCSVDNLRPVEYINLRTGVLEIGLIAHEVQEHFPHLVFGEKDDPETYQSVNYVGLIPILIKEVQELKKELKSMRENIL